MVPVYLHRRVPLKSNRLLFIELIPGNPCITFGWAGIYSFMQDQLIGQSSPTSGWIKDCLGSSALSEVADEPIIYSSVTLATSRYATEYAREMSEGLSSALFQACETPGVEKGLHNYLLYTGDTTRLLRFDQTSGPVIDIQVGVVILPKSTGKRTETSS